MRHIAIAALTALVAFTISISCESGYTATAQPAPPERSVRAQSKAAAPSANLSDEERLEAELQKMLAYEKAAPTEWWVTFSGDLSGSIEGKMLSANALNGTFIVSGTKTIREDGGVRNLGIQLAMTPAPPWTLFSTRVVAMGTHCVLDEGKLAETVVAIVDPDPATFKATIAANLLCGANKDKNVRYEALFDKKPHPLGTPESYFGTAAASSKAP